MVKSIDKNRLRKIRKRRSGAVRGTLERPRVVLSISNRYLRVQAVDDTTGHTLSFSSTQDFTEAEIEELGQLTKNQGDQREISSKNYSRKNEIYAGKLGEIFADKLKKMGKKSIVFDRNGRPYPKKKTKKENPQKENKRGKLKVFCEVMRNSGINF